MKCIIKKPQQIFRHDPVTFQGQHSQEMSYFGQQETIHPNSIPSSHSICTLSLTLTLLVTVSRGLLMHVPESTVNVRRIPRSAYCNSRMRRNHFRASTTTQN